MTTSAWIGLGSNLGDRRAILDSALAEMADTPGVAVRAVSSYHETRPVGGPSGQGPFLNAASFLETTLDPHQLLQVLQSIEAQAGRVRALRWGERTLDLDILIYGTTFLDTRSLRLPHPRLAFRRFVLEPLVEIAPMVVDPMTRRTIADLLANLNRQPRLVAIDGPEGRPKATVFRRLVEELPAFGISEDDPGPVALGRDDVPFSDRFEILVRKADAPKGPRRAIETLHVSWFVTDYFLGLDLPQASTRSWRDDGPTSEFKSRQEAQREGMRRARAASGEALSPTFVLILPGANERERRPGLLTVPQLWPDSDEPDAIIAEVVATCRGIAQV